VQCSAVTQDMSSSLSIVAQNTGYGRCALRCDTRTDCLVSIACRS